MAAGVVPQSSCSFSAQAPPRIISSSAAGREALPLPAKPRFIGKASAASIMRAMCQGPGVQVVAFVPAGAFTLQSGQENLQDYRFYKHVIHHLFCHACGVEAFARGTAPDGAEMVAVNVRCLDEVDLETITPTPFNGRAL